MANVSYGSAATVNNNASIPNCQPNNQSPLAGGTPPYDCNITDNQSLTLSGGTYYVHHFEMGPHSVLTMTGPVVLYCTDHVHLGGTINTYNNVPANFQIYCGGGDWAGGQFQYSTSLYAYIYATGNAQIQFQCNAAPFDFYGGLESNNQLQLGGGPNTANLYRFHRDVGMSVLQAATLTNIVSGTGGGSSTVQLEQ
jgi:hypothetical protein